MAYYDILLDENGDIRFNEYDDATLAESVIQAVNVRLKWFAGEWPFDTSRGFDWFGDVFVKEPDEDVIARSIRSEIADVDGITSVESVDIDVDNRTRSATISWVAKSNEETLKSEVVLWANMVSQKMALF